jgi:hypothetical protein
MDFEKETFSNVVISTKLVDAANLQWSVIQRLNSYDRLTTIMCMQCATHQIT